MCGRYFNTSSPAEIADIFGTGNPLPNYPACYNVAPTQAVLAVRYNPATGERSLDLLRWGLVPHWANSISFGVRCINARAETLATAPAFRDAFAARRCLIPASGFYEWHKLGAAKQAYAILPVDAPLFAFAGLWENWRDRKSRNATPWVRSCTIITGEANELMAPIHTRMPVILPHESWAQWLGEAPAKPAELMEMLRPFPPAGMRAYPVGAAVNSVKNDDASLIDAV